MQILGPDGRPTESGVCEPGLQARKPREDLACAWHRELLLSAVATMMTVVTLQLTVKLFHFTSSSCHFSVLHATSEGITAVSWGPGRPRVNLGGEASWCTQVTNHMAGRAPRPARATGCCRRRQGPRASLTGSPPPQPRPTPHSSLSLPSKEKEDSGKGWRKKSSSMLSLQSLFHDIHFITEFISRSFLVP